MATKDNEQKIQSMLKFHQELRTLLENNLPPEDISAIRKMLANYFLKKADDEMEKLAAERGWTQETYNNWLNEKS